MRVFGQVPEALPRMILDRLSERWAIQFQPRPERRLYWQEIGVHIVDMTQESFMLELAYRLQQLEKARAASA